MTERKDEAAPAADPSATPETDNELRHDGDIISFARVLERSRNQLRRQLAEEIKNKKQFERDWLEACDAQLLAESDARELWEALYNVGYSKVIDAALEKHRAKYGSGK